MNKHATSFEAIDPPATTALDLAHAPSDLSAIGTSGEASTVSAPPEHHQAANRVHDEPGIPLNVEIPPDPAQKPIVQVGPEVMEHNVNIIERRLSDTGRYFQRGGLMVKLKIDPSTNEAVIQPVSKSALTIELDSLLKWQRYKASSGEWVTTEPPAHYRDMLVCPTRDKQLNVLKGIAHQPFLRQDGSLCTSEGYDEATGLFVSFGESDYSLPPAPTRSDAEKALAVLQELLIEVPFAEDVDRSATLSAMITAAVRPSLSGAPMFHARAHQAGSGKTFLCRVITAFATARTATPVGFPGSNEECGKVLLAALKNAPAVIEFDNLNTDIRGYDSLCSVLTSERFSRRILGQTDLGGVDTRTLFLSSGNNVGPIGDMSRRCITINLDANCEIPAARSFTMNPLDELRRDRARFVAAALTIVRAWICAGSPLTACPPLGSFEAWSSWCRQPLLWLDQPDPATSAFTAMADDPDRDLLGRFLAVLDEEFPGGTVMVKDIIKVSNDFANTRAEDLRELLQEITGERYVNVKKLGHWVKRHAGQVVDGKKLMNAARKRNAQVWKVVEA